MAPTPSLFHHLLRPSIVQILRAQGFHSTQTSAVDSLTDLTARYLYALCEATAHHMGHLGSSSGDGGARPSIVDVRMALQDCGAIVPNAVFTEQAWHGEDTRGVDAFIAWAGGLRNKDIKRIALDGDTVNTDYLSGELAYVRSLGVVYVLAVLTKSPPALKNKHSHAGEDSKYSGSVLGSGNEHGEVAIEGGEAKSIRMWRETLYTQRLCVAPPDAATPAASVEMDDAVPSPEGTRRSASSDLTSLGAADVEEMDLS